MSTQAVELLFRVKAEGKQAMDEIQRALKGVGGEVTLLDKNFDNLAKTKAKVSAEAQALAKVLSAQSPAVAQLTGDLSGLIGSYGILVAAGGAVAASFLKMAAVASEWAIAAGAAAEAQANVAARTGLTIKEVGLFQAAAEDAGLSADAYTNSMRTLSRALSENTDEGQKAKRALRELGIETHDQFGSLAPMGEVWKRLAVSIGDVEDPARRARLALDILGRSGLEILPQLNSQFAATLDEYERMGIGFDDASAKAALGFDTALDQMTRRWKDFKQDVGVEFAKFLGFGEQTRGLDNRGTQGTVGLFTTGGKPGRAKLFDFDEANRRRDTLLNGGLLQLSPEDINAARPLLPGGVSTSQLQAQVDLSKRQEINRLLRDERDITAQIAEAKKQVAEATRQNDPEAVGQALAEVKRLEAIKTAATEAKAGVEALRAVQSQLKAVEAETLGPVGKLVALRQREIDSLRSKGVLTKEILELERRILEVQINQLRTGAQRPGFDTAAPDFAAINQEQYRLAYQSRSFQAGDIEGRPDLNIARDVRAAALESARLRGDSSVRLLQARVTPGNELAVIFQAAEIRKQTADEVARIEGNTAEAQRRNALELYRIRVDTETQVAELAKRNMEQYRETAGRIFDTITQSGGGFSVGDFFRGQARIQGRALFQNASAGIFQRAGSLLGQFGAASGIPRELLRGTLFDPQNAELAQVNHTDAMKEHTKALKAASMSAFTAAAVPTSTGALAGGLGFIPGVGAIISDGNGITGQGNTALGALRGQNSALTRFLAPVFGGATSAYGGLFAGLSSDFRIIGADGRATDSMGARAANVASSAALLAGAGLGIYSGIKQGGAAGALTATGSALGALSAIPGPQQPFFAAGAAIAGLFAGLMPDARKQRDEEINRAIAAARYEGPAGRSFSTDLDGRELTRDKRGNLRGGDIVINVNALDARSIMDRSSDIADAVRRAMTEGHDLNQQIGSMVAA